MKKVILGLMVVAGLGLGVNTYTNTPEYKLNKEIKVVANKIESNIRLQTVMSKNQKHGKVYTSKQWDDMHKELNELRELRKELQARVK